MAERLGLYLVADSVLYGLVCSRGGLQGLLYTYYVVCITSVPAAQVGDGLAPDDSVAPVLQYTALCLVEGDTPVACRLLPRALV